MPHTPKKRGRPQGSKRVSPSDLAVKQTVSLRPRHIAIAKRLGAGNVSKGIQAALDAQADTDR